MVAAKIIGLLMENFNPMGLRTAQPDALDHWEIKWMERFPINLFAHLPAHYGST
jgi:hypothetical protein